MDLQTPFATLLRRSWAARRLRSITHLRDELDVAGISVSAQTVRNWLDGIYVLGDSDKLAPLASFLQVSEETLILALAGKGDRDPAPSKEPAQEESL